MDRSLLFDMLLSRIDSLASGGRLLSRRSIRRIGHRRMDSLCRERNPFALQAIMNSYSGYLAHFDTNLRDDCIWCA